MTNGEQILQLRQQGDTYSQIMKELGVSKSAVSYWCNPKVRARALEAAKKAPRYSDWSEEKVARIKETRKKYREKNKKSIDETVSRHKEKNKQKIREYHTKYTRERRRADPEFKLKSDLRRRLYNALKGNYKSGSAVHDLGCSIPELKQHLENQFTEGMTWGNHGEWHIDHIIPMASFDLQNRDQLLTCCHYSNLQPLWSADNLRKGSKLPCVI